MYNGALLFCHLLIISAVEAGTGGVSFWRENFTMTCPKSGAWFKKGEILPTSETSLTVNGKSKGLYHCEYKDNNNNIKYYFYVEGKVCAECFELDATLFGMIIIADVSITIVLMAIIYKFTKKKSSSSTTVPAGPVPPSPDYDHLKTQTQDPYSTIGSSRSR